MKTSLVLLASLGLATAWPTQLTFNREDKPLRKLIGENPEDSALPRWRKGGVIPHPGPPREIDMSDYTIAQILNGSLHAPPHDPHQGPPKYPPLKKFAFFVNISNSSPFKDSIADEKAQITLLAPDDFALTPPHRRDPHHGPPGHHGPPEHHEPGHEHEHPPHHHEPGHEHDHPPHHHEGEHMEEMSSVKRHPMHSPHLLASLLDRSGTDMTEGDEDKHEERKEMFLRIITILLRYTLVDSGAYTAKDLINNATIASSIDGARIRVQPELFPYPSLVFNFFARTRGPTIKAKNGVIHMLNEPLLAPLTPLEELFLFPFVFSELTSGVQKVDLDSALSPWVHHEANDEVAPVVHSLLEELVKEHKSIKDFTVFAPSNRAFLKLGPKINAFLFSPFGRHVLKAILSYHIVPDVSFFSDFISDPSKVSFTEESVNELPVDTETSYSEYIEAGLLPAAHGLIKHLPMDLPGPGEIKVKHYYLTTLFNDTKVPVDVYESRRGLFGKGPVKRDIWVGQEGPVPGSRVHVAVADGVAFKGAVHVIGSLIRPPFAHPPHYHEGEHKVASSEQTHKSGSDKHEERHFWRFARSLSPKKGAGCRKRDIWAELLKA